ncbi:MAG TPA: hypothetical protein DCG53_04715 [Syntrophus sp. (in: bacteria)]|jgi:uncharacterized Zn-finger protein|nr:hypothetical protein [Syntrophus sp. (in: bacteria)]
MASARGKKRWRKESEFDRQFKEGKEHITCPHCNASLGDHWTDKKGKHYSFHPNVLYQFGDDRRHVTCPKCSALLGEVYWEEPTTCDRVKYFFRESWKGVASMSLMFWGALLLVCAGIGAYNGKPVPDLMTDYVVQGLALVVAAISFPCFLLFQLVFLSKKSPGRDDWDEWWWYDT